MDKIIERTLKKELLISAKQMPVISLSGPRQSGKTTLAKEAFPSYKYVNLEEPSNRLLASQDPHALFSSIEEGLIIDEVQRVPDLFSYIQVIVDENPKAKFVLTGSQNFLLSSNINQTLAGRVSVLNLLPFSTLELWNSGLTKEGILRYIFKGGYPRLYGTSVTPHRWISSYIRTYLERDVRDFVRIRELDKFQIFLQLCASRVGQLLNYTDISTNLGVSDNTVREWLSVLEASYIIYRLPPYFKNLGKRLVKSRKIYFYDTGLLCHLLGIRDKNQLFSHYHYGSIFENFIMNDILKHFTNQGEKPRLYYWRESNGIEIDVIIDKGTHAIPIEIKASSTPKLDFLRNIDKVRKLPKSSLFAEGVAIYAGDSSIGRILSWKDLTDIL